MCLLCLCALCMSVCVRERQLCVIVAMQRISKSEVIDLLRAHMSIGLLGSRTLAHTHIVHTHTHFGISFEMHHGHILLSDIFYSGHGYTTDWHLYFYVLAAALATCTAVRYDCSTCHTKRQFSIKRRLKCSPNFDGKFHCSHLCRP